MAHDYACIDVTGRVNAAIAPLDDGVFVAGVELATVHGGDPSRWAARYRRATLERFLSRRPNATEATWRRFQAQLTGQVRSGDEASWETLGGILALIDGL